MRYVLYHANCYDGFGAAYAAWKKYGDREAVYLPVSYGYPPPPMPEASEILIVDFSYPADTIRKLHEKAPVTLLDHHKTAQADLAPLLDNYVKGDPIVVFDMERSGALITWEYLHPGVPAPELIQYISDRDLWRFALPHSATVHKALVSYPMNFELWDKMEVKALLLEGVTCERLYSQLVESIIKSSWFTEIDGQTVPVVNTSIAWSEVGHALLEKYPSHPFVASFTVFRDQVMWSLRSRQSGNVDVSAIAKKFGGGGHANAAGFKTVRY